MVYYFIRKFRITGPRRSARQQAHAVHNNIYYTFHFLRYDLITTLQVRHKLYNTIITNINHLYRSKNAAILTFEILESTQLIRII